MIQVSLIQSIKKHTAELRFAEEIPPVNSNVISCWEFQSVLHDSLAYGCHSGLASPHNHVRNEPLVYNSCWFCFSGWTLTDTDLGIWKWGVAVTKTWKWLWDWIMGKGWRILRNVTESLCCLKQSVGRNMDIKGWELRRKWEHSRKSLFWFFRIHVIINRMLVKIWTLTVLLVRTQEGNEEHYWKLEERQYFLYSGKKNLAELYPIVVWNTEFISDELGYLAKALSKKHVEGMAWFLLAAYNKMQEER